MGAGRRVCCAWGRPGAGAARADRGRRGHTRPKPPIARQVSVIADLCSPWPPPRPIAADAAAYAAAGDEARAAGDVRIAAVAYRKAAALGDARAARRLVELCPPDGEPALQTASRPHRDAASSTTRRPTLCSLDTPGAHFFRGRDRAAPSRGRAGGARLELRGARSGIRAASRRCCGSPRARRPASRRCCSPERARHQPAAIARHAADRRDHDADHRRERPARDDGRRRGPGSGSPLRDAIVWREQRSCTTSTSSARTRRSGSTTIAAPITSRSATTSTTTCWPAPVSDRASRHVEHRHELDRWDRRELRDPRARFRAPTEAPFDGTSRPASRRAAPRDDRSSTSTAGCSDSARRPRIRCSPTGPGARRSACAPGRAIGCGSRRRQRPGPRSTMASIRMATQRRDIHGEGNGERRSRPERSRARARGRHRGDQQLHDRRLRLPEARRASRARVRDRRAVTRRRALAVFGARRCCCCSRSTRSSTRCIAASPHRSPQHSTIGSPRSAAPRRAGSARSERSRTPLEALVAENRLEDAYIIDGALAHVLVGVRTPTGRLNLLRVDQDRLANAAAGVFSVGAAATRSRTRASRPRTSRCRTAASSRSRPARSSTRPRPACARRI